MRASYPEDNRREARRTRVGERVPGRVILSKVPYPHEN